MEIISEIKFKKTEIILEIISEKTEIRDII